MADYYKFEIANWNEGTDDLTLEQEAAYLRVINAIQKNDAPVPHNDRVLAGMFRTSTRKARKLLQALVDAGKVTTDGDVLDAADQFEICGPPNRTAIPVEVRAVVRERDGAACQYCGCTSGPFEIDHVFPYSRGGTHDPENLVVACRSCNRTKRDRTPAEMGWLHG